MSAGASPEAATRVPFLFGSSRGQAPPCAFSAAVLQGLAPDGGLYVPLLWPRLTPEDFAGADDCPVNPR